MVMQIKLIVVVVDRDARRKIQVKPLEETNTGVAQA